MSLKPLLKARPRGTGAGGVRLRLPRTRAARRGQQPLLRASARPCSQSAWWTDLGGRGAAKCGCPPGRGA